MHRDPADPRPTHACAAHTSSPVQIRAMQEKGAPVRVIAPGRVYRMDMDQTHAPMFHQVEGMAIGKDISMANLKWTLEEFCPLASRCPRSSCASAPRISRSPSPRPGSTSTCSMEGGQLKIGEGDGWLEIYGLGVMQPKVLAAGGIDPEEWQGFAFGMGIDRIAMLKYGIGPARVLWDRPALAEALRLRRARSADCFSGG